jgi:TetR/AcrR family transcriptional regulator, acrAB operon repressor
MARKTKEAALATRSHILDTAELVFEQRGVAGSSLDEIARAAGLTRGAIYWHFDDKADLFDAMMKRATLPLEETVQVVGAEREEPTLGQLRSDLRAVFKRIVADPQMRRVFEIAIHKVEYAGETQALRERHLVARNACMASIERTFRLAMRRGELSRRVPAVAAGIGLQALFDGLLQNWILDPSRFDLVKVGTQAIDTYLAGLV